MTASYLMKNSAALVEMVQGARGAGGFLLDIATLPNRLRKAEELRLDGLQEAIFQWAPGYETPS